jgi:anthranilate synthase component 1
VDRQQFDQLREQAGNGGGWTRIPVWRTVLADLDTPLSVYLKLADGQDSFLFESVEGGETWGRYSIIGLPCRRRYTVNGHTVSCRDFGRELWTEEAEDPLARIDELRKAYRVPDLDELPVFSGGLVGYFGYETVELLEPRLAGGDKPDQIGTDDIVLLLAEEVAVFDALQGRLWLIVHADPEQEGAWEQAQRRLDQLEHRLRSGSTGYGLAVQGSPVAESDFEYGFEKDDFLAAVARSKEYILAGDIFQVVLSQRMSVPFAARPIDVYRALRALNPSPYMYFIDLGDTQIVGSSPEVLVRVQDRRMTVRPIAGTRPRGANPEQDRALAEELLADPKECAEHLMLVDLGRNDVGRVAATGTVSLTDSMVIERYSHVMHIVSQVEGDLAEGLGAMDAIRAAFPAGTLSGAPKIRAMEIIGELEPVRRNIYSGAVGYLSWHDDADLAIAIRTAVIRDGKLHVQAGAGIVADSDPQAEWEECMNKGRAVITAVDRASRGL